MHLLYAGFLNLNTAVVLVKIQTKCAFSAMMAEEWNVNAYFVSLLIFLSGWLLMLVYYVLLYKRGWTQLLIP